MIYKYNVSIIVSGIRKDKWIQFYHGIKKSIGQYTFELIITGPIKPDHSLLQLSNFTYICSYGTPSRCTQIAALIAKGELIYWLCDDGVFLDNSLELAIQAWYDTQSFKTQIVMKYLEGEEPNMPDMTNLGIGYWHPWFHKDLRLPGIPKYYLMALNGLMHINYFKQMGGFDCRFEHVNLNCIDLSCRIQYDNGSLYLSPKHIVYQEWQPNSSGVLMDAYFKNDKPLFDNIYSQGNILETRRYLDYNNWIYNSDTIWSRKFNTPTIKVV